MLGAASTATLAVLPLSRFGALSIAPYTHRVSSAVRTRSMTANVLAASAVGALSIAGVEGARITCDQQF